jgi:hypothetical protein
MNLLVLKATVALAIMPLSLDVPRRFVEARLAPFTPAGVTSLFLVSRVTLAFVAFELLSLKLPGDPAHYYAAFGEAVLTSGRTAASPYSPGFDYLMAILLRLFHTPASFIGLMIAAEAAAFALTTSALRSTGVSIADTIAALWFVSPISIFNVALGGQDEALIVLTSAGVLWAAARKRDALAGVCVACGLLGSKILAGFSAVPLLGLPGRRLARAALAGIALVALATAVCVAANVPVLSFLAEAQTMSSGNLWALASLVLGRSDLFPMRWMLLIAIGALVLAMLRMQHAPIGHPMVQMLRAMGTVGCVFLLVTPKAFASYVLMFLPGVLLLLWALAPIIRTALVVAFLPMAVLEPTLWFSIVPDGLSLPVTGLGRTGLLMADAVLIAGYGVLAWKGWTLRQVPAGARPQPADWN